ncbi:MAG: Enhancer of polycomb-like protein 1 [Caeruleum heppii]|nr:MAG: Enhancer of polycomb-like protein 1 [Caeruleum heppii]
MTRAGAAGARFRQRKLSTRQALQIVREDQVEKIDDDHQRNIPKVDTGVEKGEEIVSFHLKPTAPPEPNCHEHHLQAAISASQAAAVGGKVAQIYIPTPDTIRSNIQYDRLYPLQFSQPATYIRFSSTVEDCSGCQYCMSDEDDAFLRAKNEKVVLSQRCSENQFEEIMDFFERTARSRQPFAAVDNAPALSYDEMESSFDETMGESVTSFAKDIYDHWLNQRTKSGNKILMPGLRVRTLDTGQDTDDADPYVCFRRREVRQVRKTRGRDAQSTEKLRRLRKEMEDTRQLLALVKQREMTRREMFQVERTLFEQRSNMKEVKRKLGIKGDDVDLINQKPQKKKPSEQTQRQATTQLRLPSRIDGRPADPELILLQDTLIEKQSAIQKHIDERAAQFRQRNHDHVDLTTSPLTSTDGQSSFPKFRSAITEYLPTPPASVSSEASGEADSTDVTNEVQSQEAPVAVRYASPTHDGSPKGQPAFRRRIGRGGRFMIDRRGFRVESKEAIDPRVLDRFKYDPEDDDEDLTHVVDRFDTMSMFFRASFMGSPRTQSGFRAVQAQTFRTGSREAGAMPVSSGPIRASES